MDDNENKATLGSNAPTRIMVPRRRIQPPPAEEAGMQPAEPVLPDPQPEAAGKNTIARRRALASSPVPELQRKTGKTESPSESVTPLATDPAISAKPIIAALEAGAKPAPGGEKAPSKTLLRVILIVLIAVTLAVVVYVNVVEPEQSMAPTLSLMPTISQVRDDPEGDELAVEMYQRILRGEHNSVLEHAGELRSRKPANRALMMQVFLAEAVTAVLEADAVLRALPKSTQNDATLTLEERMQRHERRLQPLSVLAGLRIDWGDRLLSIPSIREIYTRNTEEVDTAIVRLETWREAQTALTEAAEAMEAVPMNFDRSQSLLLVAGDMLEEENLLRLGTNIGNLKSAQEALDRSDIKEAYDSLRAMEWAEGDIDPNSTAYEHRIELQIRKAVDERDAQIRQWRLLYESGQDAQELYESGEHAEAVEALVKALSEITPDSQASEKLASDLSGTLDHYIKIRDLWESCQQARRNEDFSGQLRAFNNFMMEADDDWLDAWQQEACELGLNDVKGEMREAMLEKHISLMAAGKNYTGMDGKLRNPESPRQQFMLQAGPLRDMAKTAEEIIDIRELLPNWDFGEEIEEAMRKSRAVLSDYTEQVQRLFNMGKLYRSRGGLEESKECFFRVIFMGELKSNLYRGEARIMLDDKSVEADADAAIVPVEEKGEGDAAAE